MVAARRLKIYVVGGDAVLTRTLADFLVDLQYEAVPLSTLEDLEASLEADAPQTTAIAVTLLETLGSDPVGRLRRIQARQGEVVSVLIAGGGFPAREAAACGVRACLGQPLRLTDLEVALAGLCRGPSAIT